MNFPATLIIRIYSSIIEIFKAIVLPIVAAITPNRHWDIKGRQAIPLLSQDSASNTIIWVHAASLGECRLLCSFIDILRKKHPDHRYIATAATHSGVGFLEKNRSSSTVHVGFLPFDTIALMSRFIVSCRISRVWIIETELWPSMLWVCKARHIPVGIVNGRIENDTFTWYRRLQPFLGPVFSAFDIVLAQNEIYAERFKVLGVAAGRVKVTENLKSRIAINLPSAEKKQDVRKRLNIPSSAMVITAGCIHPGEGKVIQEMMDALAQKGLDCRCIIVPRHIEAAEKIAQELTGAKMLQDLQTTESWKACIIAKYGILLHMYMIAEAAVVGGTFVNVGGHNVWEPAQFGIPVFWGPHHHEQAAGCENLEKAGVGFTVGTGQELAGAIIKILQDDRDAFIKRRDFLAQKLQKQQSTVEELIP